MYIRTRICSAVLALALVPGSIAAKEAGGAVRMERDLLGEKAVPATAYYGVQTARAMENFQMSHMATHWMPGTSLEATRSALPCAPQPTRAHLIVRPAAVCWATAVLLVTR